MAIETTVAAVFRAGSAAPCIETLRRGVLRDDEVLVRLVATGICHTDLVCRDGFMALPRPIVLGHEGAGVVEQVGAAVSTLAPGDPVVLSFAACGKCQSCKAGHPAYCAEFAARNFSGRRPDGSTALDDGDGAVSAHFFGQSSFASHSIVRARDAVRVRRDAPLQLLGPLGCGVLTGAGTVFNVLQPAAGEAIVIYGGGGVGLSAVMVAAAVGCAPIIVVEPNADRRRLALDVGATDVLDPSAGEVVEHIRVLTAGGAEYAIDTSGLPQAIAQAIDALASRGTIALISAASLDMTLPGPLLPMLMKGVTIRGVSMGDADPQILIPRLIDLMLAGQLPLAKIVQSYDFTAIETALDDQAAGRTIKAVLQIAAA